MATRYTRLGDKVKRLRKKQGLTQEKLAELANVDPKSIIAIESGTRNPTLKTLNKLAKALNVTAEKLLTF